MGKITSSKLRLNIFALIAGPILIVAWLHHEQPLFFSQFYKGIPARIESSVSSVSSVFVGGDHMQVYYLSWKLKDAIVNGTFSPFVDGYNFATNSSFFIDLHVGIQFLMTAVAMIFLGDTPGYNVGFVLLPLILTFFGGYFLASQIVSNILLRVAAGLFLAMIPDRIHQIAGGHSGGVVMMIIPYYFGALIANRKKPQTLFDVAAGLALFFAVVSDEHTGYYLLLCSALIFLIWAVQDFFNKAMTPFKAIVRLFLQWRFLIVGLVLSVSYGILVNRVVLSDDGVPKFARTLREVRSYSQGLDEFFAWPSDLGLLLFAALGFGVLMLLVVARQKKSNWQSPYLSFFICGFLCSILMLGMGGHWTQNSGLYELFFDYMPFFNKQRVPIKMYSTVATLLVILCLHVYDCLRNEAVMSPIKWRRYLSVGAAALVFVGIVGQPLRLFANGSRKILFENTQSGPLKLFAYLRQHTTLEDIILIQPTNDRMDVYSTLPQYFAVQTGRRFVQGYNGNPPASYYHIVNTQSTFSTGRPSRTAMEQIEKEGFTYLLHSKSAPASTRPEIINKAIGQMPFLEKKVCDGDFCLYKIEKSKVELAEFINYGLTGYQSYHGNTGQWMMREKSIVMTQGFSPEDFEEYKVISYFDSPLPDNQKPYKIRINLEMIKDMDLWIIQPGVEPLCVTVDEFEEQDRKKRHVIFEARSKYFYLATKDSWTAAEVGSTGAGEFAVFVKNIEVLK